MAADSRLKCNTTLLHFCGQEDVDNDNKNQFLFQVIGNKVELIGISKGKYRFEE